MNAASTTAARSDTRPELRPTHRRVEHLDTDASGVVHFARYASLLETAVLENLHELGAGLSALHEHGLDLAVTELRMRYHAPARFLDELELQAAIVHVGAAQVRVEGAILLRTGSEPTLLAAGLLVLGTLDRSSGSPAVLPPPIRSVLEENRHDPD
jgi:acyl-CoA thioester hydrolase